MTNDQALARQRRFAELKDELEWLQSQSPSEGVSFRIVAVAKQIEGLEQQDVESHESDRKAQDTILDLAYLKAMASAYQQTAEERGEKLTRIEAICRVYLGANAGDGLNARGALQSIAKVLRP